MTRASPPPPEPGGGHGDGAVMARSLWLARRVRTLIGEHAEVERETARSLEEALAAADRGLREATRGADDRLAARLAQVDAEEAKARKKIEAWFASKDEPLRADRARQSASEEERRRTLREKARQALAEQVWLAETVVEGAAPRLRAQHEATLGEIRGRLKELESVETAAAQLAGSAPARGGDEIGASDGSEAPSDALVRFDALIEQAGAGVAAAGRDPAVRLARSGVPVLGVPFLGIVAAAAVGAATGFARWEWPVAAGVAAVVLAGAGAVPLMRTGRRRMREAGASALAAAAEARRLAALAAEQSERRRDAEVAALGRRRATEVQEATRAAEEALEAAQGEAAARLREVNQRFDAASSELRAKRAADLEELTRNATSHRDQAREEHTRLTAEAQDAHESARRRALDAAEGRRAEAAAAWSAGMSEVRDVAEALGAHDASWFPSWDDPAWSAWSPPEGSGAAAARLGVMGLDVAALPGGLPEDPALRRLAPERLALPAAIDLPGRGSLLIEAGPDARDRALATMRVAMLRLLTALPPGRVRFTIIDPVGLGQSFAGFMRLTDHDPALVQSRIWTEPRHIEQRLADLTEHMENVIQKYLRDEYPTIEAYNEAAGEIAEPYRYLVVADFPANFSEESCRRLASIAESGPRCGVHTIVLADPGAKLPEGFDLGDLRAPSVVLGAEGGAFRVEDAAVADLPLALDPMPEERLFDDLLRRAGAAAVTAGRVEVPFGSIAPPADRFWTRTAAEEVRVPLGKSGATRIQDLSLGRGTSQHTLIAGKTGSGKSTLLHVLVTTAAMWYGPDELEFYLVDFKKGVEFKAYAGGGVPHIRAVAIESDREFGLSVLGRLDEELKRRGDLFRAVGAQSIGAYRRAEPGARMPRILLVIDEFQEFFVEDDALAQDASLLLDRLVRQGRAFGIHVLLGSQTLSGAYTLARSTVGQMGVRIALQCSETDSYLILSEDNGAARLLSRPGEAIYNDAGGLVEGNTPFQTAWLSDRDRDGALAGVAALARERGVEVEAPIVFEGNASADLARNAALARAAEAAAPDRAPVAPVAWVGEPVAIKAPTGAALRRRSGSNLLIVGQQGEAALGMLASALLGLAAQHAADGPGSARFVVLDPTPEDDPLAGTLARLAAHLPHRCTVAGWREADAALVEVEAEVARREEANLTAEPALVLIVNGLHRLRSLRKRDDDFSFSMDEDAAPSPSKAFARIVREGPGAGVFVLCWCDTATNLGRSLDRSGIGEFEQRVLMQMSSADSSMLIESASAGRLGLRRAIFHADETGQEEKFRPYGVPEEGFAHDVGQRLRGRETKR